MKLKEYFDQPMSVKLTLGVLKPVRINQQLQRIYEKYPVIQPNVEDPELEEKLEGFENRLNTGNWLGYKWRHASDLARSFLCSDLVYESRWSEVRKVLFDSLIKRPKRSFAKAFFESYIITFDETSPLTKALAISLAHLDSETLASVQIFIDRFQALEPKGLTDRLGGFMMDQPEPYMSLKDEGFVSPHMSGLLARSFENCLNQLKPRLQALDTQAYRTIFNWLHPDQEIKSPLGRMPGITAILDPFVGKAGPEVLVDEITNFLFETYGDPRITRKNWVGIDDKHLAVIFGWLTKRSLKAFFAIISKFDGSHMWEPRKKYWSGIFDVGKIDNAWVVLNKDGEYFANELAREKNDKSYLSYGKLTGSGDKTCYFIMQIGDAIVVEGSHNFALRYFKQNNQSKPKLSEKFYSKGELINMSADERITHDASGKWENKSNKAIRKYS